MIGGGIVGAGAAYRLVGAGVEVTVVDRGDTGRATAAGAGVVACQLGDAALTEVGVLLPPASVFYKELVARLADDGETNFGYEQVGALVLATNDAERARLAREFDTLAVTGEVSRIEPSEAKRLFPPLRDDVEALHVPGIARVDGRRVRESLLRAAERRGGTVVSGDARLVRTDGRVSGVDVDGTQIAADAVIVAAGAWGDSLTPGIGVYPERGQILHLSVPGADTSRWPILASFRHHYMLTFPPDRVIAGATYEDDVGYDYRVTAAGQAKLIADAFHLAPGLAQATVIETRVGFRPRSRDGLPILGAVPGVEGLYVANGLGSLGLTMGPYVGALVADLACGGDARPELEPFRPGRPSLQSVPSGPAHGQLHAADRELH